MNAHVILVGFAIVIQEVLSVTDNLQNKIALEVLKVSPESTVVSPLALWLPLCKLASVAKGHAKVELMNSLGFAQESEIETCYNDLMPSFAILLSSDMMAPNVIYLNDSLELDPRFTNNSRQHGVRIDKVGYRYPKVAAKYMNRWFAQETLFRVSTLIDEDDIDNTTSMVILNGIYSKVQWEMPFDIQFTKPIKFYDMKKSFWMIPMFCKIESFIYVDDVNNNVKVVSMKMVAPDTSITFFLPDTTTGLPNLIKKLSDDPQLMTRIMKSMQPKLLRVYLPRMKIKTYVDWSGFMRLIGINDIFSVNGSGLEGMLKTKSQVYLSKAKQKVFMEMDEAVSLKKMTQNMDSERTAREYAYFGDNVESVEFDHPFLFVVHLSTGRRKHQVLTGVFYGPQEE